MVMENKIQKEVFPGACSCMTLTSKTGKHYWFRTCDIDTDLWKEGAHVVKQPTGSMIAYDNGKKEICQYSFTGMTYNALDTWLLDGVNEQGLCGGLLMLYEGTSVEKPEEGREGYSGMELVTKILSSCKDVEEVIVLAEQIQVLHIPFETQKVKATTHYFFVDESGNEVILEAADSTKPGIIKIFQKNEILGVMTNSPPYQEQLQNFSWFLSQSPELNQRKNEQDIAERKSEVDGQTVGRNRTDKAKQDIVSLTLDGRVVRADENAGHLSPNGTFPASYASYDRFIRLAVLKALNDSGNHFEDGKMLALGSGIMNTVWEPPTRGVFHYTRMEKDGRVIGQKNSFTQYISMYDMAERCFYMKKYDEIGWKKYFQLDFP